MDIIPVIDIRHGIAVRAVAGDRANYQPLVTPLVRMDGAAVSGQTDPKLNGPRGPAPLAIARAYRHLYPFSTIYIADLDGIEGRVANAGLGSSLAAALPGVEFWIDSGDATDRATHGSVTIIGSETLGEPDVQRPIPQSAVLSLDFRGDDFIGPLALLWRPDLWPERVIVMTLARVGSDGGPDLERIAQIVQLAPHARVYAAGGIRDVTDLRSARNAGAHGALIASALHGQKIKADDLQEIIGL